MPTKDQEQQEQPEDQQHLAPSEAPPAPPKIPTLIDVTVRGQSPEGFEVDVTVRNIKWDSPAMMAKQSHALTAALQSEGFKVLAPPAPAPLPVVAASAAGGTAVWIEDAGGGPPTCSVHQKPAKWIPPGKNKQGKDYPGFWACDADRNCKPKKQDAA